MQKAEMNISLPTFDELVTAVTQPGKGTSPVKADRTFAVIKPVEKKETLKVAAYCRVSTDHEEQQSSIKIQRGHFASLAAKNDDWEFAGIYHDIISGTKKEKRLGLMRLLSDCAMGKVNLVLTKSVSRFARNTTDLLEMVRGLTANGTDIYFEREKIDTRTMGTEFLLTILGSLAEDESHSISANCRWGLQKRFQDGSYRAASAPYGYDLVDGNYAVNEEEAEIVREVYRRKIAGESTGQIAKDLNERGILTKRAGQKWKNKEVSGKWTVHGVGAILKNEAYVGDLILQKSYTDRDFQTKPNDGKYPQYYLKDHHPAIISREDYETVKTIREVSGKRGPDRKRSHTFSGKLFCGECGAVFYFTKNRAGNSYWICRSHMKKASDCPSESIPEQDIKDAYLQTLKKLERGDVTAAYKEKVRQEFRQENLQEISGLEQRREEIEIEIHSIERARSHSANPAAEYKSRTNALKSERMEIDRQLGRMEDKRISETEELQKLVNSRCGSFVFEEDTFLEFVDRVTVHSRGHYTFRFRCGLEMDERSSTCR